IFVFELELVEIGNDDVYATVEFPELSPTDVRLHGGIGYAHDFYVALARKIIGSSARPASKVQEAHSRLQRSEKDIVGFIGMRKNRAREYARAVIVGLGAVGAEHVVIGTIFVIVLEKVAGLGSPLHELAAFKLVQ